MSATTEDVQLSLEILRVIKAYLEAGQTEESLQVLGFRLEDIKQASEALDAPSPAPSTGTCVSLDPKEWDFIDYQKSNQSPKGDADNAQSNQSQALAAAGKLGNYSPHSNHSPHSTYSLHSDVDSFFDGELGGFCLLDPPNKNQAGDPLIFSSTSSRTGTEDNLDEEQLDDDKGKKHIVEKRLTPQAN